MNMIIILYDEFVKIIILILRGPVAEKFFCPCAFSPIPSVSSSPLLSPLMLPENEETKENLKQIKQRKI